MSAERGERSPEIGEQRPRCSCPSCTADYVHYDAALGAESGRDFDCCLTGGAHESRKRCDRCDEALVYQGLGEWSCPEDHPEATQ